MRRIYGIGFPDVILGFTKKYSFLEEMSRVNGSYVVVSL